MIKRIKRYLIAGVLVLVPFLATVAVVYKAFNVLDGWIKQFGVHHPGAGIAVLFAVLFLTGLAVHNYFGRKVHQLFDWLMLKVPGVSFVYSTVKDIAKTLLSHDKSAFQEVVMINFAGCKAIALVTGDAPEEIQKKYGGEYHNPMVKMVYVMQSFTHGSGFLVLVPSNEITPLNMSVETAMKLILSGGMVKKEVIAE